MLRAARGVLAARGDDGLLDVLVCSVAHVVPEPWLPIVVAGERGLGARVEARLHAHSVLDLLLRGVLNGWTRGRRASPQAVIEKGHWVGTENGLVVDEFKRVCGRDQTRCAERVHSDYCYSARKIDDSVEKT